MKISKVLAGVSALAVAATMALSASAADVQPFFKGWTDATGAISPDDRSKFKISFGKVK